MSAFCTPTGVPFHLGTYFPPTDRFGRPGFPRVLLAVSQVYREHRDQVNQNVEQMIAGLRHIDNSQREKVHREDLTSKLLIDAGSWLIRRIDPIYGGFASAPKFPSSPSHALLACVALLQGENPQRKLAPSHRESLQKPASNVQPLLPQRSVERSILRGQAATLTRWEGNLWRYQQSRPKRPNQIRPVGWCWWW